MSDRNNNSPPNGRIAPPPHRRSSIAGQAFAELFAGRNRSMSISEASNSPPAQYGTGPITAAAAQANQRRLSLSTVGLGNSPPAAGSYFGNRTRGDSISSSNNASVDESAVEEETSSSSAAGPATFGRRVSFGARALRDVKGGNGGTNGRVPSTSSIPEEITSQIDGAVVDGGGGGRGGGGAAGGGDSGRGKQGRSSPIDVAAGSAKITVSTTAKGRETGFNWADNMRTRAERSSISGAGANMMGTSPTNGGQFRSKSIAVMQDQPVREAPKPARTLDHTQERILKGDFYMD